MTKAPRRKPHIGKTERRSILRAAAKRKPKGKAKTKPEKPGRKKRVLRETEPVVIRRARGPDLKPRKRRSDATMTQAKTEGNDVKDAEAEAKAKAEADAKAKAEANAKAYADAEAKAKAEAKAAGVPFTPWPKYGSTPTEAEKKARADAEAAAKARAEAAGQPWTAWPKPEGKEIVEDEFVTVYDASSGQTKQMKRP